MFCDKSLRVGTRASTLLGACAWDTRLYTATMV
jgi:hypothetical protein